MPLLAQENIEDMIHLPKDWAPAGAFLLKVQGNSMEGAHILDGDYVLVHPQQTAANGDIVVALIGDEATVKRFYKTDRGITLKAENPKFQPIEIERSEGASFKADRPRDGRTSRHEEMITATETGQLIVYVTDEPIDDAALASAMEMISGDAVIIDTLADAKLFRTCSRNSRADAGQAHHYFRPPRIVLRHVDPHQGSRTNSGEGEVDAPGDG